MKTILCRAGLALLLPLLLATTAPAQTPTTQPERARKTDSATSYPDVLQMLRAGKSSAEVLKRLEESPTQFTLDASQVRELQAAGASAELLKVMQQRRVTLSGDVSDFAFILDCSGSMAEKTSDLVTKMDAAKKVTIKLIRDVPPGKRLTFMVYGHNIEEKCKAIKLICTRQVADDNLKDQLAKQVAGLKPMGHTPIAGALRLLEAELKGKVEGLCEVVLITDGVETCHGNPAVEARQLAQSLKLLNGVNVVGFDINPKEREQVKQIADAGGGKYYEPGTAQQLLEEIEKLEKTRQAALAAARAKAEEEARRNGARREAAVTAAEGNARKAERSADEARESAGLAGKTGKEAVSLATEASKGLEEARKVVAEVKKAEEAATEAGAAARKGRKAATDAAAARTVDDASPFVETAAEQARKAEEAAAAARAAAEKAVAARTALATAVNARPLGEMDPVTKALIEDLKDKSHGVRENAAKSLLKRGDKAAVPALMDRLSDDNFFFASEKDAALAALRALAPDKVTDALINARKSKNGRVRTWATQQLGKLK